MSEHFRTLEDYELFLSLPLGPAPEHDRWLDAGAADRMPHDDD